MISFIQKCPMVTMGINQSSAVEYVDIKFIVEDHVMYYTDESIKYNILQEKEYGEEHNV
jgi:hypothetical protein